MAYTLRHTVNLGEGDEGKTLRGQMYTDGAVAVGDPITTGFTDRGNGVYWFKCSIPDGFGGFIDFVDTDLPTQTIDSVAINPQDAEEITQTKTAAEAAATLAGQAAESAARADGKLPANTSTLLNRIDAPVSSAVSAGTGDIAVDHDYGGTDELQYVLNGVGVDGGRVTAYLASDYDASTFTPRAQITTGTDGRWIAPMMLDDGDYVLAFDKPGVYSPTIQRITVSE